MLARVDGNNYRHISFIHSHSIYVFIYINVINYHKWRERGCKK